MALTLNNLQRVDMPLNKETQTTHFLPALILLPVGSNRFTIHLPVILKDFQMVVFSLLDTAQQVNEFTNFL